MARDRLIDFESPESHFLFNPRLGAQERTWLDRSHWPELKGHVWLASSGTTTLHGVKVLALSKRALLIAAAAANRFLESDQKDIWMCPLPLFHVGGLAIYARAHLSGADVVAGPEKWSPTEFLNICQEKKVTLTSLVPTQVYDLVAGAKDHVNRAPSHLRAVLVGGGALSPDLYWRARELGWPLLPTFGMSEVGSQVATAPLSTLQAYLPSKEKGDVSRLQGLPEAELLPHLEARTDAEGRLELRSEALFTFMGEAGENGLREWVRREPSILNWSVTNAEFITSDGWYRTQDIVQLTGRKLKFVGRATDLIKVSGELVNLVHLKNKLRCAVDVVFLSEPDARLGQRVIALSELHNRETVLQALNEFNGQVAPYERVRAVYFINSLPKTSLGKIKTGELAKLISDAM